jgi:hypothetical protein
MRSKRRPLPGTLAYFAESEVQAHIVCNGCGRATLPTYHELVHEVGGWGAMVDDFAKRLVCKCGHRGARFTFERPRSGNTSDKGPPMRTYSSDDLHTITLGEAWRIILYFATCQSCNAKKRVDLKALAEKLGDGYLLKDVRLRLKCQTCGAKKVILMTLWKDATTTINALHEYPMPYD